MASPDVVLRVVDASTGEIAECGSCAVLADQLKGAERDIRAWRSRCAELERDREREARAHELWPMGLELFELWKTECGHPRSRFGAGRFFELLPLLMKYDRETCEQAIRGIGYDPYTSLRKNGTTERHDDWGTVFKNEGSLERYANKAPLVEQVAA